MWCYCEEGANPNGESQEEYRKFIWGTFLHEVVVLYFAYVFERDNIILK